MGITFFGIGFWLKFICSVRVQDGNPNEVYAAFLPLCLLLIGLACRGYKLSIIVLADCVLHHAFRWEIELLHGDVLRWIGLLAQSNSGVRDIS